MMNAHTEALDYNPCRYGTSRLLFRGPQRDLHGGYVACLGGSETFGQFIPHPYPSLLEEALDLPCANLGCRDAGVDTFMTCPGLIEIAGKAQVTVIQVLGAANMSNRLYNVDPRRNHRFIRATKRLKELYPEVDFREFELTGHMLTALARVCQTRLQSVRREVQTAWVSRMKTLIERINGPVVLLWLSDHRPYSKETGGTITQDPLFVDRAMLNEICADGAAALIEVVAGQSEIDDGLAEMVFNPLETPAAHELLGPVVHRRTALALQNKLSKML